MAKTLTIALLLLAAAETPVCLGTPLVTVSSSAGRGRADGLCEALRQVLPNTCIVNPTCFGFACIADMFGKTVAVEADIRGVCNADARVAMALERVGGPGAWTFEFDSADELRNEMIGLDYEVARCPSAAGAYAKGALNLIAAQNLTQITLGLDACCNQGLGDVGQKDDTIVDDGIKIVSYETGPEVPDGCYDISVHRCDCDVLKRDECEVRNQPGEMRWFWTPGCSSCEGHQTCGAALDVNLPRNFLDDWVYDFTDVCPTRN